jgi:CDP-paratose 2-epimerase
MKTKQVLITGGAGFVGSNLTSHFMDAGFEVVVVDSLSRPGGGAIKNLKHLIDNYGDNALFKFLCCDVRDTKSISGVVKDADVVIHCAAQTAMTTSLDDPISDFEINALGTLNILEACRLWGNDPLIIYFSTNKVYGDLTAKRVDLVEKEKRWDFLGEYESGIDESYPLDYKGCYGCSKGAGDAYCLDYAKTFKMKTVVMRMSGMYGVSQYPTEDQGWIAWILKVCRENGKLNIYGDGKQVRDILYISDLVRAIRTIMDKPIAVGQAFNLGGGRENSISIIELLEYLNRTLKIQPSSIAMAPWRRADQKVYISNLGKAKKVLDWEPLINKYEGIERLFRWMEE